MENGVLRERLTCRQKIRRGAVAVLLLFSQSFIFYPMGLRYLGFGSNVESPWRADADESTTISFSTDVNINGKKPPAGKYGFFIALYPDSCVLIFNKNVDGWGSYFYRSELDVLRVTTFAQKNQPTSVERLDYNRKISTIASEQIKPALI